MHPGTGHRLYAPPGCTRLSASILRLSWMHPSIRVYPAFILDALRVYPGCTRPSCPFIHRDMRASVTVSIAPSGTDTPRDMLGTCAPLSACPCAISARPCPHVPCGRRDLRVRYVAFGLRNNCISRRWDKCVSRRWDNCVSRRWDNCVSRRWDNCVSRRWDNCVSRRDLRVRHVAGVT